MATGDDLKFFSSNLAHTRSNVKDLRGKVDTMGDAVKDVRQALEYAGKVETQSAKFLKTIKSMKFSLKVTEKAGPLKVVSKVLFKVLDKLEDVTIKIRDKAHDLNVKIKESGYIDKLKAMKAKLDGYELNLFATEIKLGQYKESTDSIIAGFELVGAIADPLEAQADTAVRDVNVVLHDANTLYDSIEAKIEGVGSFLAGFRPNVFEPLTTVAKKFAGINNALEFLSGPLNAVYSALKPVEGLLDAIGFIYSITVGPIIDWVLDKLGITKIMDKIADKISGLLPGADVLDAIEAQIDGAFVEVDEFLGELGWNTDIASFVDRITDQVFPGIDEDAPEVIRIGTDGADELVGRENYNDVLDGGRGNDTVSGLSGDDMILASAGDDFVMGGLGDDRLIMGDSLLSYTFVRPDENGPVIFRHHGGEFGQEFAYDIEKFVFTNGTFTWQQLRDNVKSVNGTEEFGTIADEVFYAVTGSGSVTIHGEGGNDQLTGSEFADVLNGGAGDDQITSMRGADTVNGGAGNDTWIYAENSSSGNALTTVDLVTGETWDGDSRDTLISIENIIMQDSRDTDLFGNDVANVIVGGGSRDWIDGRGGDDNLSGGGGSDILIGGAGVDTLHGGDDSDKLVAGGSVVVGRGESYNGGDGFDTLIYSNDYSAYNVEPRQFTRIAPQEHTGRVQIFSETGRIERLSADGNTVLAVDIAQNIESFVGSDEDDIVHGSRALLGEQLFIDGGGGNDILYSNGATETRGGKGDDLMHVIDGGSFDGGDGTDTLDTRGTDARWFIRLTGAIGTTLRAYEVDESNTFTTETGETKPLQTALFSGNLRNTEIAYLGRHDDEVRLEGSERMTVYGGDGEDRLIRGVETDGTGSGHMYGEGGNDYLELRTSGALYGGLGDDELVIDAHGSGGGHAAYGGGGNDAVTVTRMGSQFEIATINGGDGNDRLTIVVRDFSSTTNERAELDLQTGVLQSFSTNRFGESVDQINAIVSGFEEVIGSDMRDLINGTDEGERFVGRGGNDTINGNGGGDEIFGSLGNDLLDGGDGDDLLHGGVGHDTIRGGDGIDTASYLSVVPGELDGSVTPGEFGSIFVELGEAGMAGTGQTSGGVDALYDIENVVGGSGSDLIIGNSGANALFGGDGDDTLDGRGGDDVLVLGTGDDSADGGDGDDTFILDLGNATVNGGAGFDTLDLGNLAGRVTIDMNIGVFAGQFDYQVPVWRNSLTSEARIWNGVALTPQDVLETEAIFSNSSDDLTRDLPGEGAPEAPGFELVFAMATQSYTINYTSIEKVIGGVSTDTIIGRAVDDTIESGDGNDTVRAGDGADWIYGGTGFDNLFGEDGNDRVWGGDGRDRAELGQGADMFFDNSQGGANGQDTVFAGAGNDTIEGGNGNDSFYGEGNNDVIRARLGNDRLFGGDGFDTLDGGDGNDTVYGGNGRDRANLGNGNDVFFDNGQGGDLGRDTVYGGAGNDTINGGAGHDEFHGLADNDVIRGGAGNDKLFGGAGFDTLDGGDGNDSITGGNGRDVAYLGNGNDVYYDNGQGGDLGRDTVYGGAGNDTIEGGNGNDLFLGGDGADVILGRLGADTINGGFGNDTMNGGDGADTFVFTSGFGTDTINGYAKGTDMLRLDDALWNGTLSATQVVSTFGSVVGGNVVFDFGTDSFTLAGVGSLSGIANDLVIV